MNNIRHSTIVIIVVGALCIFVTMGIRQSFGLFLPIFTSQNIIGTDLFSFAIALQNVLWGIASPLFGAMADRRGAVLPIVLGSLFYAFGVLLMGYASGGGEFVFAQFLIGLGLGGAGFSVVLGTVGKISSDKNRTFNLAIVTAAGSLGQFVLVISAQLVIDIFDFRSALYMLAAFAAIMLFFAPLMRIPSTVALSAKTNVANDTATNKQALLCALTSPSFILLFLGFFVCGFQLVFIATYIPAYVRGFGITGEVAATALSMVGLFNIFGSLFCGWVGTRVSKKKALAIFYSVRSMVIVLFLLLPITPFTVIAFGAAMGFLWLGTVPLTSGLVAVMFGTRHMSMLYGMVFLSHQLGSAGGALIGAYSYGQMGSYTFGWIVCIGLGFVATALHLPIKESMDDSYRLRFQ